METDAHVIEEFGKRIQRCYGCFIAYHLKDMYLGEDVTFFCDYCKDETMFHFDEFSKLLDIAKLNEVTGETSSLTLSTFPHFPCKINLWLKTVSKQSRH